MKTEQVNDLFKKRLTDAYKLRREMGIDPEQAIKAIVHLAKPEFKEIARAFLQELAEGENE